MLPAAGGNDFSDAPDGLRDLRTGQSDGPAGDGRDFDRGADCGSDSDARPDSGSDRESDGNTNR